MESKTNRKLLMGNEAIALGALRAGVRVCSGYPGTPSTEILEHIAREKPKDVYYEWSVNEKSAIEVAAGAAQSGARSMATMKQVGLNVASDPLMSLNYVGVKAGMVVVVADDPGPISSQTEQDTRHFGRYAKICVFDPATPEEAYIMMEHAFELSEQISRPVILRPTTRVCHSYATVEILPDLPRYDPEGFSKDDGKWVIFPRLSYANKLDTEKALKDIACDRGTCNLSRPQMGCDKLHVPLSRAGNLPLNVKGIAAGGVSRQYVKEALGELRAEGMGDGAALPPYIFLEIDAYPMRQDSCIDFLKSAGEVLVIEELDPVIEDELAMLAGRHHIDVKISGKRSEDVFIAGECSASLAKTYIQKFFCENIGENTAGVESCGKDTDVLNDDSTASKSAPPPLPVRPPVLCAGCPHRGSFFAVKEAMKDRAATYSGDIGCYTLGNAMPLDMVDTCLCMGAGITQAQGIARAQGMKCVPESDATRDRGTHYRGTCNLSHSPRDRDALHVPLSCVAGTVHFAFIGDSTFFHTGVPGLINAVWNAADIVVCILDNSTTAMTGGQSHPGMGRRLDGVPSKALDIQKLAIAAGVESVRKVDAFDVAACIESAKKAADERGVRVIIFEGPCINEVPKGEPLGVSDACTGCGVCVNKLGCPALTMANLESESTQKGEPGAKKKRHARVDSVLCTGCGVCVGVCPVNAIVKRRLFSV